MTKDFDYPIPEAEQQSRALIVLRQAVSESLEKVLDALPELIARALPKPAAAVNEDALAEKLAKAVASLRLPAPALPERFALELSKEDREQLAGQQIEKAVTEAIKAFAKDATASPTAALDGLIERMAKNPKIWLNVRLSDGKKFIEEVADKFTFSLNQGNMAKESSLQSILQRLNQTLTVSGLVGPNFSYKTVAFTRSSSGTIVSAVSNKRIKVFAYRFTASAQLSAAFRDGSSTMIDGQTPVAQYGGFAESVNPPNYLFATSPGNSLDLFLTTSGVAGRVSYWDDDAT